MIELNVGEVPYEYKYQLLKLYKECYLKAPKPKFPEVDYEVSIHLKYQTPFNYQSRRLSYLERNAVKDIGFNLLNKAIIRESKSEYCSPIVLVKRGIVATTCVQA